MITQLQLIIIIIIIIIITIIIIIIILLLLLLLLLLYTATLQYSYLCSSCYLNAAELRRTEIRNYNIEYLVLVPRIMQFGTNA